jgi:hypothetical protein
LKSVPAASALAPRQRSLTEPFDRSWLEREVDYLLGEDPAKPEARLRGWFPTLVAQFFVEQYRIRPDDSHCAVGLAKKLAALQPSVERNEVIEAFDWHSNNPTDGSGRKVFARPDVIARVVWRIKALRQQRAPLSAPTGAARMPTAEEAEHFGLWLRKHLHSTSHAFKPLRDKPPATPADLEKILAAKSEIAK